ncbi:PIR Superfamily Protein [Plasmodium ovale curtisi]|uniref:PIR Superfamily Protein n=1 Tax=Plasmodium ovale curtisi TaxID=864141 RepID=A0A1A8X2U3_PLAOA|nr:PIR Superfamily Protein [Plasmodium ovale curtisi]
MGSKGIDDVESILKGLPSYAIYKKFSELHDVEFCQKHFTNLLNLRNTNNNITEFCNNISGIAKHLSENIEGNDISENCEYVNFYIYDRFKIKFRPYSQVTNKILSSIDLDWYLMKTNLLKNKCSFKFYHNIDVDKWNDMKIIYDYKNNYNYIKENTKDYATCKKYEKYLNEVKTIYNKKNSECCDKNNDQCGIFFFKCNTIKSPDTLLREINCPGLAKDNFHETEADGNKDSSNNGSLKTSMVAISPFIGILASFFFSYKDHGYEVKYNKL